MTHLDGKIDELPGSIRNDFPLLSRTIDGERITYLDSASTAPKPTCVIDAVARVYGSYTANVHRGVHLLADEATEAYEGARGEIASFLNASSAEIVFTRNTTEAINLVASGIGLGKEDEVVITALEHHSNFMPWEARAKTVPVALADDGLPLYGEVESYIGPRTRLLALAQISNTAGIIAPVAEWAAAARRHGLPLLVDASQSASHVPIDVKALDCDFLVLSGHKLLGPSGIGVLYGKRERLEGLSLYQTGGGMVRYHGEDRVEMHDVPQRFEAGTPNIEGAIGLGAAVSYLRGLGMENVLAHSLGLGRLLVEGLRSIPGTRIVADSGPLEKRIGLAAFSLPSRGMSQESIARLLCDRYQILVSGGFHCAHILHHRLGLDGTLRVSTHVFNTADDIERVLSALREIADSSR
jgi:cysteine desulfurase / selenocysteine lyase